MARARTAAVNVQNGTPNTRKQDGLRSPGWLGSLPLIGLIMVLAGSLVFGAFAYNVQTNGPLLKWDVPLAKELHAEALRLSPRALEWVIFGFFVGKELVIVIAVILAIYFLHKRFWTELAMVLIGIGGGGLLWYFLSSYFDRPRPTAQIGIAVTDASFPSGHVITAVLAYGLLAYLLVPKMPDRFWKWVIVIGSLFTILFIGFSRMFLGGHYLSDLLAGYSLGIAWAGLVYTVIERLFVRRERSSR